MIPGPPDLREKVPHGGDPRDYFHGISSTAFQHCAEFFRCTVKSGIAGHGSADYFCFRVSIQIIRYYFRLIAFKNWFAEIFQLSHATACAHDQVTLFQTLFCLASEIGSASRACTDKEYLTFFKLLCIFLCLEMLLQISDSLHQ